MALDVQLEHAGYVGGEAAILLGGKSLEGLLTPGSMRTTTGCVEAGESLAYRSTPHHCDAGESMQDEVAPAVPARRGKKPTAPDHIKVYKTAVFKIHNPSNRKRAMLTDSMKRAHFAYTRLLAELMPDVERFAGMTKKDRNAEMQTRIYRFVRPLPLGQAAKAGIRIDVQGQLNSYIELRKDQEGAQVPTASRLNEDSPAYDFALAELATLGSDIDRENELRDEIARLSKSPRLRPISYYGNTRGFYLFLWDEKADRYLVWLTSTPKTVATPNP
jgi:hypothetical protein